MTQAPGYPMGMARDWRERLRAELTARGLDMKNVSKNAGLGETGVRDMLERTREPKLKTIQAVLTYLNLPLAWLEEGEQSAAPEPMVPVLVAVTGEAAAGVWVEQDVWDTEKYDPVPVVPGRYASVEQRAWRIVGPSMDLLKIEDGDFVITVPYWIARISPQESDIVIIERRHGALVERTCKQVTIKRDGYELWPRSTDKRYQSPLHVPRLHADSEHGDNDVEIIGLVIGKFRPM